MGKCTIHMEHVILKLIDDWEKRATKKTLQQYEFCLCLPKLFSLHFVIPIHTIRISYGKMNKNTMTLNGHCEPNAHMKVKDLAN